MTQNFNFSDGACGHDLADIKLPPIYQILSGLDSLGEMFFTKDIPKGTIRPGGRNPDKKSSP
jgi:hypothetical protein